MQPYTDLSIYNQKLLLQKILFASIFIDIILGYIAGKANLHNLHGYLLLNAKHDFIKTTLLKIQFGAFSYAILHQFGTNNDTSLGSKAEAFILGYALFIIMQWLYFLYLHPQLTKPENDINSICYRVLIICIDPFLQKKTKCFGSLPKYNLSWNWRCFVFLEFWFLWNGVYGLGMFLLMFYFTLYPIIPGGVSNVFAVWLLIRGMVSFLANYIKKYSAIINNYM